MAHGHHVHQRHAITNRATDLWLRHIRRLASRRWIRSIANADGTWDTQTLTQYLNDSNNFTGYTQVLRATQTDPTTGQTQQVTEYTIGLHQISQTTIPYTNGQPGAATTLYFGYECGHGSVRVLMNAAAAYSHCGRRAADLQL